MSTYRLQSEVQHHYVNQALRQLYVLVLGLDVLGNPFGLAMGIGKGAKDLFYEPIQVRIFCVPFSVSLY
jgi:vacuolar protein sorting-associated protein 13A/C